MKILVLLSIFVSSLTNVANADWISTSYNGPKIIFSNPTTTIDRYDQAYETLKTDPVIQKLLKDKSHALMPKKKILNNGIETTKFQHFYKGVEVVGSGASKHSNSFDTQISNRVSEFDLDVGPTVSEQTAISLAQSYLGNEATLKKPILKIWPRSKGSGRLVYQIASQGNGATKDLVIDAQTGQLVGEIPHHIEIAPVSVFSANEKVLQLPENLPDNPRRFPPELRRKIEESCQSVSADGRPVFMNVEKCNLMIDRDKNRVQPDISALNAQKNAHQVLEYYKNTFNRNSFDGRGTEAASVVHIGLHFPNAFWHSGLKIMAYGDGDGTIFRDFSEAVDIAGHEMTHGLIDNDVDGPQLIPMAESGALNEAYADFFGKMVENQNNWVIGHTVALDPSRRGFRDLANPASIIAVLPPETKGAPPLVIPYPAHVDQMLPVNDPCTQENDFCWVHINATIPGHASYLVTQAIGVEKTQQLYYTTMTHFISEVSTFEEAAAGTLQACAQLFDKATCSKVKDSFSKVGLAL
jgi:Zn-dependent metalloprotease